VGGSAELETNIHHANEQRSKVKITARSRQFCTHCSISVLGGRNSTKLAENIHHAIVDKVFKVRGQKSRS